MAITIQGIFACYSNLGWIIYWWSDISSSVWDTLVFISIMVKGWTLFLPLLSGGWHSFQPISPVRKKIIYNRPIMIDGDHLWHTMARRQSWAVKWSRKERNSIILVLFQFKFNLLQAIRFQSRIYFWKHNRFNSRNFIKCLMQFWITVRFDEQCNCLKLDNTRYRLRYLLWLYFSYIWLLISSRIYYHLIS